MLDLTGTATVAQYQAALQSITFSTTADFSTTRSISIVAIDGTAQYGTLDSSGRGADLHGDRAADGDAIGRRSIRSPSGGSAVAVDSGLTVTSSDTDLTGATVTISN